LTPHALAFPLFLKAKIQLAPFTHLSLNITDPVTELEPPLFELPLFEGRIVLVGAPLLEG